MFVSCMSTFGLHLLELLGVWASLREFCGFALNWFQLRRYFNLEFLKQGCSLLVTPVVCNVLLDDGSYSSFKRITWTREWMSHDFSSCFSFWGAGDCVRKGENYHRVNCLQPPADGIAGYYELRAQATAGRARSRN